ncbi:MAG TPA: conjugal transfer protein TraI [Chryseosolibacter sp.]
MLFAAGLTIVLLIQPCERADAAIPIAKIIKEGVKKVIQAVDLMIQRLQNKTIWLQNAQKVLENKLNELKLTEIADWTEKHRKLYQDYYEELWKVKNTITMYQRVRRLMNRQLQVADQYRKCIDIIENDENFSKEEIHYMSQVYAGILEESVGNLDQVLLVISSFKTQMSDGKRLELIEQAASQIDQNYFDLQLFNTQNMLLSINRSKDAGEINIVRKLYGLGYE